MKIPFLLLLISAYGNAQAEDRCGPRVVSVPQYEIVPTSQSERKEPPEAPSIHGLTFKEHTRSGGFIYQTARGTHVLLGKNGMPRPVDPQLNDATLIQGSTRWPYFVWKTAEGQLVASSEEGQKVQTLPAELAKARFMSASPEGDFIATLEDQVWVFDNSFQLVRKWRMDKKRFLITSERKWFAAYDSKNHNVIVYGMQGERISEFTVAFSRVQVAIPESRTAVMVDDVYIAILSHGAAVVAGPMHSGSARVYSPSSGQVIGTMPQMMSNEVGCGLFYEGIPCRLDSYAMMPTSKVESHFVSIPCSSEDSEGDSQATHAQGAQ